VSHGGIEKLNQLLSELFDEEAQALGDDTPFTECPSWDSLKHVELVVGIERRFAVELSTEEIARLTCKLAALEVLTTRGVQ
jgi:acyl carrier protein